MPHLKPHKFNPFHRSSPKAPSNQSPSPPSQHQDETHKDEAPPFYSQSSYHQIATDDDTCHPGAQQPRQAPLYEEYIDDNRYLGNWEARQRVEREVRKKERKDEHKEIVKAEGREIEREGEEEAKKERERERGEGEDPEGDPGISNAELRCWMVGSEG